MAKTTGRAIREELLAGARTLIQSTGVTDFSYGDLATLVGIKSPSIHHHFRRKDDLVAEVARLYRADFGAQVDQIDSATATERINEYAELFGATAARGALCLCGSLAAEWRNVGKEAQAEVEAFFEEQSGWLEAQFVAGIATGEFRDDLDATNAARATLAMLEGSILMARATGNPEVPETIGRFLLQAFT